MKNTLYLVRNRESGGDLSLLPTSSDYQKRVSVVLVQGERRTDDLPYPRVFALGNSAAPECVSSTSTPVSYEGLLALIFEADNVVVL